MPSTTSAIECDMERSYDRIRIAYLHDDQFHPGPPGRFTFRSSSSAIPSVAEFWSREPGLPIARSFRGGIRRITSKRVRGVAKITGVLGSVRALTSLDSFPHSCWKLKKVDCGANPQHLKSFGDMMPTRCIAQNSSRSGGPETRIVPPFKAARTSSSVALAAQSDATACGEEQPLYQQDTCRHFLEIANWPVSCGLVTNANKL